MTDPAFLLEKKTTLVVGASSGIGRATALAFATAGAAVACADVEEPGTRATAAEIEREGGRALSVRLDVTDGELGWSDRRAARRRAEQGAHVPHPALAERRVRTLEVESAVPMRLELDGVEVARSARFTLRCLPDAAEVVL